MATIDEVKYEGWLVIEEESVTSVNCNKHHTTAVDNAFTVKSLNQSSHSQTSLMDFPFIVDTDATVHISPNCSDFLHLYPIQPHSVKGIGGSSITAIGVSNIKLREARGASITLCNVLYILNVTVHLISVGSLAEDSNAIAYFDSSSCWITNKSTGILIAKGPQLSTKKLYVLTLHSATANRAFTVYGLPNLKTWHCHLNHANYQSLWDMAKKGTLTGAPTSSVLRPPKCDACILGKQMRTLVPKKCKEGEGHRAMRKLEKVWVDLSGPHAVRSRTGNEYVMDIVDDCTSFPWSIPLKTKDNTFPELKAWELAQESKTGLKVEIYIMDNSELKSNEMEAWLKSWGSTFHSTTYVCSYWVG
jgi:hypothetical protein